MKFIPTGGVEIDEKNIRDWFQSGVVAVGMGSKLITEEVMIHGKYDLLEDRTLQVLSIIQKVKKELNPTTANLSKENLSAIRETGLIKPGPTLFELLEKVLQFGTEGVAEGLA